MRKTNVIVIGGGPAGLMSARELAADGIDVIVLEGKKDIGRPVRCGEAIRGSGFRDLFGDIEEPFMLNKAVTHRVIYGDLVREIKADYIELDRCGFEKWLAKDIEGSIIQGHYCQELVIRPGGCLVTAGGITYKSDAVVLACGSDFRFQKKHGLIRKEPRKHLLLGAVCEAPIDEPEVFKYIFTEEKPGYFWIFPRGQDKANIGYGALDGSDPRSIYQKMKNEYFPGCKFSEYAGVLSLSGPIDRTYCDRMLICGNAAGMVYAGTGEGIYYALSSGKIAARVIAGAIRSGDLSRGVLKEYESLWKEEFGDQLRAGLMFSDIVKCVYASDMVKAAFARPTENSLRALILEGSISRRQQFKWHVARILLRLGMAGYYRP